MKVSIDRSGCIGCGLCTEICPAVFKIDDDGLACVHTQPDAAHEEAAREAAGECPVGVIFIDNE